MAKLSSVLAAIEDNVSVQFLTESMIKAVDKKRTKDTEVTFATAENDTSGLYSGNGKTAIIIWVDPDEFNNEMKKQNNQ